MALSLRPRGNQTTQGRKMKDFLSSCSARTRLRHGAGSVRWPGAKPLHHAKSFQRLDRALNVLSWALLPFPPPAALKWMPGCACLCASHMATAALAFCELGKNFWTAVVSFHLLSISLVGDRESNGMAEHTVNLWGNCLFPWSVLSPGSAQRQHHYLFLPALLMLKCL